MKNAHSEVPQAFDLPLRIDLRHPCIAPVLPLLLEDKTTKRNIILATEGYFADEKALDASTPITLELLQKIGFDAIQPRVCKKQEAQAERTHTKAEVATPAWVCNKMNNQCDSAWFGRQKVFNTETGKTWHTLTAPIHFPKRKSWKRYVDSKRLEITCGEAPYLISRYDAATGTVIPLHERIGMLDRKLRIVGENTHTPDEWATWAIRAVESIYGYEYQGDNLLIARINILLTVVEYMQHKWNRAPNLRLLKKIATRVAWNIWQMDGLTGMVVTGKSIPAGTSAPMELFEHAFAGIATPPDNFIPRCRVRNWRSKQNIIFSDSISIQTL